MSGMIQGEFLVCDDLGPLGRLVPRGELLVMDPLPALRDYELVVAERQWIGEKYNDAVRKAGVFRRRLKTAHLGTNHPAIREWFEIWEIEAAKYAVCDRWLLAVVGKLEGGQQMAMNVPPDFTWNGYGPIRELTKRVLGATDAEIVAGARFRVQ